MIAFHADEQIKQKLTEGRLNSAKVSDLKRYNMSAIQKFKPPFQNIQRNEKKTCGWKSPDHVFAETHSCP